MLDFQLFRPLKIAMLAGLLNMTTADVMAEPDRGEALYKNHCQFCHEDSVHKRKSRLVTSLESLHSWVTSWSVHAGLNWGKQEIHEVTEYLNDRYYQFPE